MVFNIIRFALFINNTSDVLSAGEIGETNSSYSEYILKSNVEKKIFSQLDSTLVMPGHGPPSSLGALKSFMDLKS